MYCGKNDFVLINIFWANKKVLYIVPTHSPHSLRAGVHDRQNQTSKNCCLLQIFSRGVNCLGILSH